MKGRVHVLRGVLFPEPHVFKSKVAGLNTMVIIRIRMKLPDDFFCNLKDDRDSGSISRALQGILPVNKVQRERANQLLSLFLLSGEHLLYDLIICTFRSNVRDILHLAHDATISGQFWHSKTLSRLR